MLRKTMLIVFFSAQTLPAMEQPQLPGELIREIARVSLQSNNWTDLEKLFLLQTMKEVNTRWRVAASLLPRGHFPYQ